ncbi:hypothetical protein JOB18_021196 [Solea senegalensis]|uniref:Uncharacterized protein n=1 Tax=Solea senegalensis TaxID=28829 RepID=A0AAV6PEP4_SOLSE|nr:hypothetical protein JOB18_021196 [Solea senegalensis]
MLLQMRQEDTKGGKVCSPTRNPPPYPLLQLDDDSTLFLSLLFPSMDRQPRQIRSDSLKHVQNTALTLGQRRRCTVLHWYLLLLVSLLTS